MEASTRVRTTIVLCAFAVAFATLTVGSYTQKSATVDEPQHLTAGYTALRLHDYRIDQEHPPLLRLWAALPLLAMRDIRIDTNGASWSDANEWVFSHHFLYELNDADRLLYRARFMMVLLGIVLGILLFCWARELFGFWTATSVLALYCVEPNVLAHSSLVTTDLGMACFSFGAFYFLWRMTRNLTWANGIAAAGFFALAQVSKFSALILGPIAVALLAGHSLRAAPWPCSLFRAGELRSRRSKSLASAAVVAILVLTSWMTVWTVYGFHDRRVVPSHDLLVVREHPDFLLPVRRITGVASWMANHKLVPDAYAQSLILGQVKAQHRTAYLAGQVTRTGWWYYFPVVFLAKTPITILLLLFCGLTLLIQNPVRWNMDSAFLMLPPATFLGAAMATHLNIGLRHILPIYPSVLLIAGVTLDEMRAKWRAVVLLAPVALAAIELATVYPHCLAFFNQIIGGPANGHLVLLDSNLDWGQDLKPLKKWMDAHHVGQVNLSYFGTADPAYYGMHWAALPGTSADLTPTIREPSFPGYVAVSVQNLHGLHLDPASSDLYAPLLKRKPLAVIGYSIHVYWVQTNWWYNPRT